MQPMPHPEAPDAPPLAAVSRVRSLDALRIERALRNRVRYRYVHPEVVAADRGWRVVSPCCSRNVDPDGGVIDIAWLEPQQGQWALYRKDHEAGDWVLHLLGRNLVDLMDEVCVDPERVFWP